MPGIPSVPSVSVGGDRSVPDKYWRYHSKNIALEKYSKDFRRQHYCRNNYRRLKEHLTHLLTLCQLLPHLLTLCQLLPNTNIILFTDFTIDYNHVLISDKTAARCSEAPQLDLQMFNLKINFYLIYIYVAPPTFVWRGPNLLAFPSSGKRYPGSGEPGPFHDFDWFFMS